VLDYTPICIAAAGLILPGRMFQNAVIYIAEMGQSRLQEPACILEVIVARAQGCCLAGSLKEITPIDCHICLPLFFALS
jgi:hypothetical protein